MVMNLVRTVALICIGAVTVSSNASEHYRAGYEVNLMVGQESYQIRTRSPLSTERPVWHDMGEYRVLISLVETSDTHYVITVAVSTTEGQIKDPLLQQTFRGAFAGVLDFSAENNALAIEGAIALSAAP